MFSTLFKGFIVWVKWLSDDLMSPNLNQFVIYPSLVEFKSKNDAQLHSMILPPYCLKFKTGDNDALEYEAQVRDFQIFHQMPERFEKMGKKLVK